MAKTIVGLYDDMETAQKVVRELMNRGFRRDDISLIARDTTGGGSLNDMDTGDKAADVGSGAAAGAGTGAVVGGLAGLLVGLGALVIPGIGPIIAAGPLAATLAGAGVGAVAGGLIGGLTQAGVPEEEAHAYAEGVRRGGTLVTLVTTDDRAPEATDIMNMFGPADIDTRTTSWKKENWKGYDAKAQPYNDTQIAKERTTWRTTDVQTPPSTKQEGERHIPIVEEEMRVGKRQVQQGGVRVHSVVTEHPVEETHTVRDERVNVERRPADRTLTGAEADAAFREQTFEVTESDEELMVDKTAHVTGEVVIRKDVEERPETVRGTVRKTEVRTEDMETGPRRSIRDYAFYNDDFQRHYNQAFANRGHQFNYYEPGYRYGYDLAATDRYRNRSWDEIAPEIRMDWERQHPQSAWDDFKDAVRHGWESVTGGSDNPSARSTKY